VDQFRMLRREEGQLIRLLHGCLATSWRLVSPPPTGGATHEHTVGAEDLSLILTLAFESNARPNTLDAGLAAAAVLLLESVSYNRANSFAFFGSCLFAKSVAPKREGRGSPGGGGGGRRRTTHLRMQPFQQQQDVPMQARGAPPLHQEPVLAFRIVELMKSVPGSHKQVRLSSAQLVFQVVSHASQAQKLALLEAGFVEELSKKVLTHRQQAVQARACCVIMMLCEEAGQAGARAQKLALQACLHNVQSDRFKQTSLLPYNLLALWLHSRHAHNQQPLVEGGIVGSLTGHLLHLNGHSGRREWDEREAEAEARAGEEGRKEQEAAAKAELSGGVKRRRTSTVGLGGKGRRTGFSPRRTVMEVAGPADGELSPRRQTGAVVARGGNALLDPVMQPAEGGGGAAGAGGVAGAAGAASGEGGVSSVYAPGGGAAGAGAAVGAAGAYAPGGALFDPLLHEPRRMSNISCSLDVGSAAENASGAPAEQDRRPTFRLDKKPRKTLVGVADDPLRRRTVVVAKDAEGVAKGEGGAGQGAGQGVEQGVGQGQGASEVAAAGGSGGAGHAEGNPADPKFRKLSCLSSKLVMQVGNGPLAL
jgi:hypothetical protein